MNRLFAIASVLATGFAYGLACDAEPRCGPAMGIVARVIDGDTVELQSGERVRYLMIDTPELRDDEPQCFGREAADFNRVLVLGRTVTLEYDEVCEDDYGRLLALVSLGDREINALLVERGYACSLPIPPNGTDLAPRFDELERAAKQGRVGMWGICDEVACD